MMAPKRTILCIAILVLVLGITQAKERIYPLGMNLTTYFKCESVPENNLSCSMKVLAGTGATVKTGLDQIYVKLQGLKDLVNESCIKAVKKLSCFGFRRCERKRQYIDIPAAILACEVARKVCPIKALKYGFLNCHVKNGQYKSLLPSATKCRNIKDSTGTCPDIKYKYAENPSVNMTEAFHKFKEELQILKATITSECYKKVKNTGCLLVGTICSPNEMFAVSYISKQECEKGLQCIPELSYRNGTKYRESDRACNHLPDESKGIDLPSRNGALLANQTAARIFRTIILFNSLLFLSR